MGESRRYQIDRTRIIFEQFEDETVLVNTETGYYYSLSNTGSEVLRLLDDGCSTGDLGIILFGNSEDSVQRRTIVDEFVEQLADENIITVRASDCPSQKRSEPDPVRYSAEINYVAPVLERFDDVRDLLLIDPIHQVDQEYGWPKGVDNGNASSPRR